MKKIILGAFVALMSQSLIAQIYTQGVDNSISGSNILIDGSSTFSVESGAGANVGKGIIIPSVDLVNFEFDLTLADGFTFPTYFDGMVVYNNVTGATLTTGDRSSTSTNVAPGFYYFSNPDGANNGNVTGGTWIPLGSSAQQTPPNTTGQILGIRSYNVNQNLVGTQNQLTVSTSSYNDPNALIFSINYTPVSENSTLIIEFSGNYTIAGSATDTFESQLNVSGLVLTWLSQRFQNTGGGGTRSTTLFPIRGAYNNLTSAPKEIKVLVRRVAADDDIFINQQASVLTVIEYSNPTEAVLTGFTCGSPVNLGTLINGSSATGVSSTFSYTSSNGVAYQAQSIESTGVTGLTASFGAGVFVNGPGSVLFNITGNPSAAGTANFQFTLGGQTCSFSRTVFPSNSHLNNCNFENPTAVVDVTNPTTGKIWMDRNLGANRAPTSQNDEQARGSLFQWGRSADGHQCVNRYAGDGVTTSIDNSGGQSPNPFPPHGRWILTMTTFGNWVSPSDNNLWQGVNGVNNPCPIGYRIPTIAELNSERLTWSSQNQAGGFASPIKWSTTGARSNNNIISSAIGAEATDGFYWSSSVSGSVYSNRLHISPSFAPSTNAEERKTGFGVRCIKE